MAIIDKATIQGHACGRGGPIAIVREIKIKGFGKLIQNKLS